MTTASSASATSTTTTTPARTGRPPAATLAKAGAVAAVGAAVLATALGAAAAALDVPLEIIPAGSDELQEIPLGAFAGATIFATLVGTLLAIGLARWTSRPAQIFLGTTVAATVLSFGPVLGQDTDDATKVVLALSHVVVAAVVIPSLTLALRRADR